MAMILVVATYNGVNRKEAASLAGYLVEKPEAEVVLDRFVMG